MSYAWAIVIQVLFLSLLMIPGVRGVQSWYLVISQVPVWYLVLYSQKETDKGKMKMAIKVSVWICVATLVLSFVQWRQCSTTVDCSTGAISTAVTVAVAVGLILSNVHVYDMVR